MRVSVLLPPMLTIFMALAAPAAAATDTVRQRLAAETCAGLRAAARAEPGDGPMLLPSYPGVRGPHPPRKLRALRGAAYVYDNAVAGIALVACGAPAQALRIAAALREAPDGDPSFHDGRLRNAYRAGVVHDGKVELPGYWDAAGGYWKQDAYQVSTATGNAAWAALLFLTVYEQGRDTRYLDAAVRQLRWIDTHVRDERVPAGYEGGLFGFDDRQQPQRWKSTEHNLDIHAAARWALRYRKDPALQRETRIAGAFVQSMWDASTHRFLIGTRDDGTTPARKHSALDAQVWPLLAFRPPPHAWNRVWTWIDAHHRHGAGYGYRRDPKGVWTEGTAQAATAMRATDRTVPNALWALLRAQRDSDGLLYATPQRRIGTDLAIGPTSTHADFYYYHQPHLGATAWAALAARGWNPFTGHGVGTESPP